MRLELDDPRLMDYVLGELNSGDALDVAAALQLEENKEARELVEELRGVADTARRVLHEEDGDVALSDDQRAAIVGTVGEDVPTKAQAYWRLRRPTIFQLAAAALFVVVGFSILTPNLARFSPEPLALRMAPSLDEAPVGAVTSDGRLSGRYIEPEHMLPQHAEVNVDGDGVQGAPPSTPNAEPESPAFETFDPENLGENSSTQNLTPEELKDLRVREHVKYAKLYAGEGLNAQAIEIYSHVLQLDPTNKEAKEGLHQASLSYSAESMSEDLRKVEADSDRIRQYVEKSKQLPEGADALGIKQYVFRVPPIEGQESASASPEDPAIVEARNRLEIKANLGDGLSVTYENASDETVTRQQHPGRLPLQSGISLPKTTAPAEEQWAEYNVGNLTGQTELPMQVASNQDADGDGLPDESHSFNGIWQWNAPTDKPTEIVGGPGTETYVKVAGVKPFVAVKDEPLSTFSIDVDTAAYSNVRRFLSQGQLPPADAVRIEEMINYFAYSYPQPTDGRPFAVAVHGAPAPWAPERQLVRIGVKGKEVPQSERPQANLVFLLDVSGSMGDANKLPLVKESMKTLLSQLRPNDRVGIVTYAGDARLVLGSTPVGESAAIASAIESLQSGGSTNGGGGIQMAYDLAQSNFIKEGINRVIMATDGDFNVGTTEHGDLMGMIEARAKSGVFLTTLGFGMGNLKDSTLEQLANRGNGNYAYIDNHAEARKALVDQLSGTLQTIAKDVKIQVEFNPAKVSHYRLLGYENRALANQDFNDDTKDAGEIGAGHTITALYEIIPTGATPVTGVDALKYQSTAPGVDPLRYQSGDAPAADAAQPAKPGFGAEERFAPEPMPMPIPASEWLTVKMRYKQPEGNESTKIEVPLLAMNGDLRETDADFRFASAVAAFGQVLRNSGFRHPSNFDRIIEMARGAANGDTDREAFVDLVITAKTLGVQNR